MTWVWIIVVAVTSTYGDLATAKGMSEWGEIESFHASALRRVLRYIVTRRLILAGIAANAISFAALLALLSVAPLSFAVPVTALAYVLKTVLAKSYLNETIGPMRWMGVLLVTSGIVLVSL